VLVDQLRAAHAILIASGHEFGHRLLAEALRFAAVHAVSGSDDVNDVLDLIAMQKLLPRLHGSRRRLQPVLEALLEWAEHDEGAPTLQAHESDSGEARLPRTHAKLQRMLKALKENQFASFTE